MELEATTPTEFEAGEHAVLEDLSKWIRGAPVYHEEHRRCFRALGVIRGIQYQEVSLFEEVAV